MIIDTHDSFNDIGQKYVNSIWTIKTRFKSRKDAAKKLKEAELFFRNFKKLPITFEIFYGKRKKPISILIRFNEEKTDEVTS